VLTSYGEILINPSERLHDATSYWMAFRETEF
jgi:hypothetical protein